LHPKCAIELHREISKSESLSSFLKPIFYAKSVSFFVSIWKIVSIPVALSVFYFLLGISDTLSNSFETDWQRLGRTLG